MDIRVVRGTLTLGLLLPRPLVVHHIFPPYDTLPMPRDPAQTEGANGGGLHRAVVFHGLAVVHGDRPRSVRRRGWAGAAGLSGCHVGTEKIA